MVFGGFDLDHLQNASMSEFHACLSCTSPLDTKESTWNDPTKQLSLVRMDTAGTPGKASDSWWVAHASSIGATGGHAQL